MQGVSKSWRRKLVSIMVIKLHRARKLYPMHNHIVIHTVTIIHTIVMDTDITMATVSPDLTLKVLQTNSTVL